MKLAWKYVLAQVSLLSTAWAVYHERSMQVFHPPERMREDAYFGYSVTYVPKSERLIISSPRADNIGKIYSCDINKPKACTSITRNITRENNNYKHDYWLGATVKAGPSYFVTCAPLYVETDIHHIDHPTGTFGHCYVQPHDSSALNSLLSITRRDRKANTYKFEETIDSFGWSMDIASDESILVGGPAMFTGRVMKYPSLSQTPVSQSGIPSSVKYNFGYSVASGDFYHPNSLVYAVGSPYGRDGRGEVVFFNKHLKMISRLYKKVDARDVGAMFGAVLCTARIAGQRSDLLVGAPAHAGQHHYNVGAVYVYVAQKPGAPQHKRTIEGHKDGSFFGSAIATVGDLNGDGRDEIVIAAPYEDDGRGAVYIYSGDDILLDKPYKTFTWLQRIQPEGYRSFGLSLSALPDYDKNGCNELAIGAPGNDAVALLRCMASVTITKIYAVFPDLQNRSNKTHPYSDRNETYFLFKSCIDLRYPDKPANIEANISMRVEIIHQSAVLADPNSDGVYSVLLQEKKPVNCENIGVYLPENGNYDLRISYKISAELSDSPILRSNFEASRVILSDRSVLSYNDTVWAAECKGSKSCVPDLDLEIITSMQSPYVIGSTETENVSIAIRNSGGGDVAYASCAVVRVAGAAVLSAPATECARAADGADQLKCAPMQPLRTSATWKTDVIIIGTAELTNNDNNITVHADLYDNCENTKVSKVYSKVVKLKGDPSGVDVKGTTNVGDIVHMTKNEVKFTGKQIEQIYSIYNTGPTNWIGVLCNITLLENPYVKIVSPVSAITDESRINCNIDDQSSGIILVLCNLDKLEKNHEIKVVISIDVLPGKLENIIETQNVTVTSNITVVLDSKEKGIHSSVVTTLRLSHITVPLWIIIIAALVGLLVLLIIALVLRERGYLRRQNKKKLQDLKKSVRRQTIRRSMMTSSDRERLTETAEEAENIHLVGKDVNNGADSAEASVDVLTPNTVKFAK